MTQKERIENATTKQAVVFICVYSWVILRNIGRTINQGSSQAALVVHRGNDSNIIHR